MAAHSVTGTGAGAANQPNILSVGKFVRIVVTGIVTADASILSPPGNTGYVQFETALPGGAANYVIMLTPKNAHYAYVASTHEDADGNFIGFSAMASANDTDVYYLVTRIGTSL